MKPAEAISIEDEQVDRLDLAKQRLTAYVGKFVPSYRGVSRFQDLPVVTKAELISQFEAHLSEEIPNLKRDLLHTLRKSDLNTGRSDDIHYACGVVVEQTSGTSGVILLVPKTRGERLRASLALNAYRRNFDPDFQQKSFYALVHPPRGQERPFSPGVYSEENLTNLFRFLNEHSVRWIHTNPRLLQGHLDRVDPELIKRGSLRFIENTGFALSDSLRAEVEKRWNVRIVDQYGCREAWVIGVRDSSGPFSIVDKNVIVELLDDEGRPITATETEGRVVVTSIHQRLFPIVRYDTGDLAVWAETENGVGLKLSSCRAVSVISLNGRKANGIEVFKEILYSVYRMLNLHSIHYIQVQQTATFEFTILTSGVHEHERLAAEVMKRFNALYRERSEFLVKSVPLTEMQTQALAEAKPTLFVRKKFASATDGETSLHDVCSLENCKQSLPKEP